MSDELVIGNDEIEVRLAMKKQPGDSVVIGDESEAIQVDRRRAAELARVLQHFADTGELPQPKASAANG